MKNEIESIDIYGNAVLDYDEMTDAEDDGLSVPQVHMDLLTELDIDGELDDEVDFQLPTSESKDDGKRSKNFVFTINNYTEEIIADLKAHVPTTFRCLCFGREIAPTTGTPHLQGFVVFKTLKTFKQVCSFKHFKWYVERMKGTIDQSLKYCTKDKNFEIHGDVPKTTKEKGEAGAEPGAKSVRTDLVELRKDIQNGMSRIDLSSVDLLYKTLAPKYSYSLDKDPNIASLYPWQQKILDYSLTAPHRRKVLWIYSYCGDQGKTSLALHLQSLNWMRLENAKTSDIKDRWDIRRVSSKTRDFCPLEDANTDDESDD
nr:MAG: replication associated protein [Cressdnaviricota sp.]